MGLEAHGGALVAEMAFAMVYPRELDIVVDGCVIGTILVDDETDLTVISVMTPTCLCLRNLSHPYHSSLDPLTAITTLSGKRTC
jgi:hypothetical protein